MSFISKLKPRIKPRLGVKVADYSTGANIQSSNTNLSPISVSGTSSEDAKTSHPASYLVKIDPDPPSVGSETSASAVKTINNEEERTSSKVLRSPGADLLAGNSVDQNACDSTLNGSSKFPDSQKAAAKPKEVVICIREKPKPRIIGLKHYKPVIKKQVRPTSTLERPVLTQPGATLGRQTVIKFSESNEVSTPYQTLGSSSNKNESKLVEDMTEFLEFSQNIEAQKPQNDTNKLLRVNETFSPVGLDGNCSETVNLEPGKLQKQCVVPKLQDITTAIEETESKDLSFLDNQVKVKCESDPPKSGCNIGIHKPNGIKKHALIKRPPKIPRKSPKLDRSRIAVSHNSDSPITVAPPENVSLATVDGNEQKIIATVEGRVSNELDVENVSYIPIIDTTKNRSQITSDVAPLSTVSSNTDNVASDYSDFTFSDPLDDFELSSKSTVDKTKSGSMTKASKSDMEDVRTVCAISAVDYLRRHDHALGDSIIRRLIVGDKCMQNRNLKATMCSSCNPQTLQKCLSSLWSFHKDELQVILKKSAERQKAPLTFANFSGKPSFKPSLGRQRAPTLTASTYGKMCFEVKEGLAKKYGPNAPELSKLRMLDLIFYNPSDNPMSKPFDPSETASKKKSSSSPSTSSSRSRQTYSTGGSTKGSDQSDSDADDPEDDGEGSQSTGYSSLFSDNEQNYNNFPVPQVKIGDEGQIILAPESLVLKQRESEIMNSPVIYESDLVSLVRKRDNLNRTSWSFEDTVKFYKSLHGMGTDFTSMLTLFPNRTRKNLKAKFKREERKNSALIDKVLSVQGQNLSLADVEKDLAADKTLRRLCIETAAQKYSPGNSVSSVLKPSRRKKKECFSDDDEEPSNLCKAGSTNESAPALASSIPNNLRSVGSPSANLLDTSENETEKKFSKKERNVKEEENAADVPCEQNLSSNAVKSESKKAGGTFKKPVGRPPSQRKRKLDKKIPNIIKRGRKSRSKEPPRIHTICLDDYLAPDDEEDDSGSSAESDPLAIDSTPDRDDCFVIETNYEHEYFNCIKSVKFSVDNPDWPVDVNATIEHKGPSDEKVTEIESVVDESGDVVKVVTININQLPSYLEQTGAVVIEG